MTFFQPVSSRMAPVHSLLWIARKRMRPGFLRAGLNEHRLKVRLRTPQSMVVRPGASLSGRRLTAPRGRLRLPRPCYADRTRRCSRTRAACRETRRTPPRRIAIGPNRANARGRIDRRHSPRLAQVSFNRHFTLASPSAHAPGHYAEPSNLKIGIAHPWSWVMLPGREGRIRATAGRPVVIAWFAAVIGLLSPNTATWWLAVAGV